MTELEYAEEQLEELAVLQSIFYEHEIDVISDELPLEFTIQIFLDDSTRASLPPSSTDIVPTLTLSTVLPPLYPSTAPLFTLLAPVGLDATELLLLHAEIARCTQEYLGGQMIYTIVAEMKLWIEETVRNRRDAVVRELEERKRLDHEEEVKKSQGTKVTVESFNAWHKNFLAETTKSKDSFQRVSKGDRLTGRQMFEGDRNLAVSDVGMLADGDVTVDIDVYSMQRMQEGLREEESDEEGNAVLDAFSDAD